MTANARRWVQLVQLPAQTLHALAAGDLALANETSPIQLSPYFVQPESHSVWLRRSRQIEADPRCAGWITRVVIDAGRQLPVGRAGFHAPPDRDGLVELGYAIDPAMRRRGYARAALEVLLHRAAVEPAVRTVRATVSPDNLASRALIAGYGFVAVGEQWDDEDGLETIFERQA